MTDKEHELDEHLAFLLANPDKTLGSVYHDAGKCWQLIDKCRERIAELKEDLFHARQALFDSARRADKALGAAK